MMNKSDCCYEEMSKNTKVYEQSEVPCHNPPYENKYEQSIGGSNGLNQSGFKGK